MVRIGRGGGRGIERAWIDPASPDAAEREKPQAVPGDPRIIAALEEHRGEKMEGTWSEQIASWVEPAIREREDAACADGYADAIREITGRTSI